MAKLEEVLQSETGGYRGLSLFRSEAIPLASVSVGSSSMSFGDVRIGSSSSQSFTITNNSDCPVNYSVSGTPYGFSISSSGGTLSAHSSTSISVTFNPGYEQNYSGYINVSPNGSSVSVSGRGVKN